MKIAIAGYGIEGKSNYKYYSNRGYDVTIVDQRSEIDGLPENVKTILGTDAFTQLLDFDLVVRTAGLAPKEIQTNGKIWSSTNEFFEKCPAKIIGVTGTKGKGTTASLITNILEAAGKTVHLLGNIGIPALDRLGDINADDIVVYELSSFQLWDLTRSPHIAVVLMIEPDHLNVHSSFEEYVDAKANIRRWQTDDDMCVYHPTNKFSKTIAEASGAPNAYRFGVANENQVYIKSDTFFVQDKAICPTSALTIPGAHNLENACAAMSVVLKFTDDYVAVEQGMRDFHGLPHRLEYVRSTGGVKYYNDSFASAPGATVAAIRSFKSPEIIILGGVDKGADFSELAETIRDQPNVKQVIIIGEIRQKLVDFMQSHGVTVPVMCSDATTMNEIVLLARRYAKVGDIVILSPACASFDMFKNFYERGDQFRTIVKAL